MPAPVKISDRLLERAKAEAKGAHRSVTAQIEHWATLGRAGERLSVPPYVTPQQIQDVLTRIVNDPDREAVKADIRAAGTPIYGADPEDPEGVIQISPDGRRTRGRFEGRTF